MPILSSRLKRLQRTSAFLSAVFSAAVSTVSVSHAAPRDPLELERDPLESVNRAVFSFNEGLDQTVLKPAANAYKQVVPPVMRTGFSNFFSNLQNPWSAVNLMLQGRVAEGMSIAARFGANTTVGVLGLMDVAKYWGIPNRSEDFGLTLDAWGVGSGPYLVLPIFGPSNVRDALATPVDSLASVKGHTANVGVRNSMTAVQAVSKRSDYLELGDLVDQVALDKYILMRDALQKRRNRAAAELVQDADGGTE